jgi:ABC-type phosphonate transport system ATPase subunit
MSRGQSAEAADPFRLEQFATLSLSQLQRLRADHPLRFAGAARQLLQRNAYALALPTPRLAYMIQATGAYDAGTTQPTKRFNNGVRSAVCRDLAVVEHGSLS